jgi:DNA (cytosine-5)-methyltransferase 1
VINPLKSTNDIKQGENTIIGQLANSVRIVSLFSGCGGLDLGFLGGFISHNKFYPPLPFEIIQAYEIKEKCITTYIQNIGDHIKKADLADHPVDTIPLCNVLIGGFPCQDFSSCGPKNGLNSERGLLFKAFVRYMDHHNPQIVIAENVPHLARMDGGNILEIILNDLRGAGEGYRFEVWTLYGPDYGIPQMRTRLFLVGVREDLTGMPTQPEITHTANEYQSIDWAISDLEGILDESVPNQSQYFKASKAKNGNGQGDETNKIGRPSYTIRANAKSRIQFHYSLPRRLTVRECARLQTFPDDFLFPHSATENILQIGNAVPPILAYYVAQSIQNYFETILVNEYTVT